MRSLLLAALTTMTLAMTAAEGEGVVKIISSLPRTGSAKGMTDSMVNGITMAIEEVGGKVLGMPIEYVPLDDASPERGNWDPAVEQSNATKAIQDPDVMAYIGTYNSGAAKVVAADLNTAGLAMISPANTAVGLTKPGFEPDEPAKYRPSGKVTYFRVVPADDIQGALGAKWAKSLGAKIVYVLHDRELYGEGVAKVFKTTAEKIGITVAGFEGLNAKDANFRSLIVKIKASKADFVYLGATTQTNAGQVAKDLVAGGCDAKLMVPDGCYERAFIEAAGAEALNGRAYVTFGGLPPDKLTGKGAEFVEAYKAKFGGMPEAYAIYAYDAAKVTIDAIARAGVKDRAKVLEALRATKDFNGALGTWSFDENGDTTLALLSGNTVTDGVFTFGKLLGDDLESGSTAADAADSTPAATTDVTHPEDHTDAATSEEKKPTPIGLLVVAGVVVVIVAILLMKKPKG
jgi:branched-chain amino acid transport system substrate-binding protein